MQYCASRRATKGSRSARSSTPSAHMAWTATVPLMARLIAECFGTFCLVFAGRGAITIDGVTGGAVTHVGIALTFGLIVLAMIYAVGDISGAHLIPAVTLGFVLAGRMDRQPALQYLAAQVAGALAASALLRVLFPLHPTLGATLPAGAASQSLVLEIVLTLILMVVILGVSTGAKEKGITAGIAVGATIALEALFAGPICGASMNPARSLAPALVAWRMDTLWVYLAGPAIGAALAVPLFRAMSGPNKNVKDVGP